MTTFLTAQQRLARLMGDADATGTAAYAKWSQQEYKDAINFAAELLRERFLIPTAADLTWTEDQYDYAVPGSIVYLREARAESNGSIFGVGVEAGSGLFEYEVPLDLISVQRTSAGALQIHFDKNEVARHFLNQDTLLIRMEGYKYQAELSADGDSLDIPWSSVVLLAKLYLHMAGEGRDPNELMKHARQIREVLPIIGAFDDREVEANGVWLDK